MNTALANMVEALENVSSKEYIKEELKKLVEKAVNHGTIEIRKEMITMKEDIVKEAREYADIVQGQASKATGVQLALLKKQLVAIIHK